VHCIPARLAQIEGFGATIDEAAKALLTLHAILGQLELSALEQIQVEQIERN
jgi:hypothetical protein